MRLADESSGSSDRAVDLAVDQAGARGDWADQTRRILTRDLLLRAHHAQPMECHALQFRALHLNLPLIGDLAEGLGLEPAERSAVEPDALDALLQALWFFDPSGDEDFADFAVPFVEHEIVVHLRRRAFPAAVRG
jgi:hypothetical protein